MYNCTGKRAYHFDSLDVLPVEEFLKKLFQGDIFQEKMPGKFFCRTLLPENAGIGIAILSYVQEI